MGLFATILNQPSRSYAEQGSKPAQAAPPVQEDQERTERRSNYYKSLQDPNLRKEWDAILAKERARQRAIPVKHSSRPTNSPLRHETFKVTPLSTAREDEELDRFYTPQTSPTPSTQPSPNHSPTSSTKSPPPSPLSSTTFKSGAQAEPHPPVSVSSASSQVSDDQYTNYSWSDKGSDHTHITIASSTNHTVPTPRPADVSALAPVAPGWDKDVRWLVPKDITNAPPVRARTISSTSRGSSSSSSGSRRSRHKKSATQPPRPRRRMSIVREEETNEDDQTESDSSASPANVDDDGIPRRAHSAREARPRKKSLSAGSIDSGSTATIRTVELPALIPHSQGAGYSNLVLPRAYTPSKHPKRVSSLVDITKSGIASTAMSTISVTKGAADLVDRRLRLKSLSGVFSSSRHSLPEHLRDISASPVAFSTHTPPPSKVQSNQVLVQVWSVALEGLDVLLTKERGKTTDGYGFIPGRGFAGKVIESGYAVSNVHKGDWVMGLLDVGKCGALSEFIVVDRKRIHPIPRPSPVLSLDQFALLAVSGLAAHRAVATIATPLQACRVLVLTAHAGVGALICQELVAAGAFVTAQVSDQDHVLGVPEGVKAIKIGAPLEVIESLEDGAFDVVFDTVGGREVWHTCRRLFGSTGQFSTLVGDSPEAAASMHAHVKSNMRSLRSAFTRKNDNKQISYEWVSPSVEIDSQGRDIAGSLEEVLQLARGGLMRPRATNVCLFEHAPDFFGRQAHVLLDGYVGIVKILE